MSSVFYGRSKEITKLRQEFAECAKRDERGKYSGPRMVFVLGETGIGKSRLVQELYRQLASDPEWDPPDVRYWPDAFGNCGDQLLVVPDMKGHSPLGPPRFAWLGVRWQSSEVRNPSDRRSVLPELRSSIMTHVKVIEQYQSGWKVLEKSWVKIVKREFLGEVAGEVTGQFIERIVTQVPFGGLAAKLVRTTLDMGVERAQDPKSHDEIQYEYIKSDVEELLECMRSLLNEKTAGPIILWLDDAQWIDDTTIDFLKRLWTEAEKFKFPLFIVVTHWLKEWKELCNEDRENALPAFLDSNGVTELELGLAEVTDLQECLDERLPGITEEQRRLLIEKADGNFLTMIENIAELVGEPLWFVNEKVDGPLTEDAVAHVRDFISEREGRIGQRFKSFEGEIKKILGWSSQFGTRFIAEVVAEYAQEKLHGGITPKEAIDRCVDPYVVLGEPSRLTREFRDKAYHRVASEHRKQFLKGDSEPLVVALRKHLSEWVNNSFDENGNPIWPIVSEKVPAPERSVTSLPENECQEFLAIAVQNLPLPREPVWQNPEHVAALRARYLNIYSHTAANLWKSPIEDLSELARIDEWSALPLDVLAKALREDLSQIAFAVGKFELSRIFLENALYNARTKAKEQDCSYESLRDLSVSLDKAVGIYLQLDDLDGALNYLEEGVITRQRLLVLHHSPATNSEGNFQYCAMPASPVIFYWLANALRSYELSYSLGLRRYGPNPISWDSLDGLEKLLKIHSANLYYFQLIVMSCPIVIEGLKEELTRHTWKLTASLRSLRSSGTDLFKIWDEFVQSPDILRQCLDAASRERRFVTGEFDLALACFNDDIDDVRRILGKYPLVDCDAVVALGKSLAGTPLSLTGTKEIAELLVERGATPTKRFPHHKDKKGNGINALDSARRTLRCSPKANKEKLEELISYLELYFPK